MSTSVIISIGSLLTIFIVILVALPYIKKYLPGVVQGFKNEGYADEVEDYEDDVEGYTDDVEDYEDDVEGYTDDIEDYEDDVE